MIAEIRSHIKNNINTCSTKYRQIDNPFFKVEDLIQNKQDYQYALQMGSSSPLIGDDLGNVDQISVTLTTFRQGGRSKLDIFDEGFMEAIIIRDLILDKSSQNNKQYIKGITSSSVTPGEVIDSQDIYSYETNFIFTVSYSIGE